MFQWEAPRQNRIGSAGKKKKKKKKELYNEPFDQADLRKPVKSVIARPPMLTFTMKH